LAARSEVGARSGRGTAAPGSARGACGSGGREHPGYAVRLGGPCSGVWENPPVTSPDLRRSGVPRQPGQTTRRLCSASLLGQALSVFFGALVAWQLDRALAGGTGDVLLWGGCALAVLCLVAAGAMRSRAGIY